MFNCTPLVYSEGIHGHRALSVLVTYPRIIHAEMCRHRMHARNSASSRAIPFARMVEMVENNPFVPIAWQKHHTGMQGSEYLTSETIYGYGPEFLVPGIPTPKPISHLTASRETWLATRDIILAQAKQLSDIGVTKQLCNRLLEPFMWHTEIITATEWENFFDLRCPKYSMVSDSGVESLFRSRKEYLDFLSTHDHQQSLQWTDLQWRQINKSQAEIHIQEIAEMLWDVFVNHPLLEINSGDWHIPFGDNIDESELDCGFDHEFRRSDIEENVIEIATARCARLSYKTLGNNPKIDYKADIALHDDLLEYRHMSPFEHCLRAMTVDEYHTHTKSYLTTTLTERIEKEIESNMSMVDLKHGIYKVTEFGWCRNFRGFIPYREIAER